jgi:hypothetical protein
MTNEKQKVSAEGGDITIENISGNPTNALFKFTIELQAKSFIQRLKDLFSATKSSSTFYVDRTNGKYISNYLHNHITTADKEYKAAKVSSTETPKTTAKKKSYKPRKPKAVETESK